MNAIKHGFYGIIIMIIIMLVIYGMACFTTWRIIEIDPQHYFMIRLGLAVGFISGLSLRESK